MVNVASSKTSAPKKKRSSGGLKKHKPSAYNKYMSVELARLKNEEGIQEHKERFQMALESWKAVKDRDASAKSSGGSSP
ncbi:hypothetical protein DFH07DRAFT_850367 [Mycena maculata]|uniref:YABBY protein C-terminal domain-containing protein n=1 Tax=Mycena maculata TaxID=230809 RepID=A0AAD7HXD5_9AGAR|nr:hypothetical protein DFH07DRAFT_850367 [Mycena maculata]